MATQNKDDSRVLAGDVAALKATLERCQAQVEWLTKEHDVTLKRMAALQAEVDLLRAQR